MRVFDKVRQPHLVAAAWGGNGDGVLLVISSPRRRSRGCRQLEEVRNLDQPLQFVGLLYWQLHCVDGYWLAQTGKVDDAAFAFESNAHGSQKATTAGRLFATAKSRFPPPPKRSSRCSLRPLPKTSS